ncbi:MAG: UDP-N-acetylmuramate dehydrogenase [Myxococcota bacterium]
MNATLHTQISAIAGLSARFDEPMAAHTTYKVGGPAAAFVNVETSDALVAVLTLLASGAVPWLVLGNGSNALFPDRGYSGAVLHLAGTFDHVSVERDARGPGEHRLVAGAALSVTRLLRFIKEEQLLGVEFLGGVPGTVGGAVRMNAGTVAGEVSDTLEAAELTSARGVLWVAAADLGLAYRHSTLPADSVVTGARFAVRDADPGMRERLDAVLAYRKATQPLQSPSCGSVFANPPGDHAGRLIEAAGLKGHTIGGAQISELHANWIVNRGGATADEICTLIALCETMVRVRFGVQLQREVQFLGDWGVTA